MENMTAREELERSAKDIHTVWIGEKDRVASFHPVDCYERQSFASHDFFINYLCSLQKRGFRFQ